MAKLTSEFQNLVNQLTSVDLQFDDEMQALLLLSSLLESWETFVIFLSNLAPNRKLTTSMVMDALFNEEAQRREMGTTDQSELCFYYDKEGHIKRDCPKYKAYDQSSETAATVVMAIDESDVLLAASEDGKNKEVFSIYAAYKGRIWMANNIASRVVGKGSVCHGKCEVCDVDRGRCFGICAKVWPDSSGATSTRCPDRSSEEGDQVDFEELRRDGAITTRKVMYFAVHSSGMCVQGTSILWGSWTRSCQDEQLEDIGLPSSGLEEEIVKSSLFG
ncbi:hypothetical protein Acr_00g0078160 [Actinidia rufa]|uniref:Uncharacterized protein n=1 Tax=Actinidia rufa TaxID=165716 RepID=A0A7J0DTU1_9ERIC|nr:hypothetical protein Acr_00g0078160 [Actinidia rufa]